MEKIDFIIQDIYWSEDGKITSEVNFFEGENDGPQREYGITVN